MQLRYDFTETAVAPVSEWLGSMNIGDWAAADKFSSLRIVIRGAPGLYDRRTDAAMRPGRRAEGMVMPEHEPDVCIHPPAITDILGGHDLTLFMRMGHSFRKLDRVLAVFRQSFRRIGRDGFDPARVLAVGHFYADDDISARMERSGMMRHLDLNRVVSRLRALHKMSVHRNRHADMVAVFHFLVKLSVGTHRLVIRETGDYAVRSLIVELKEMRVDIDFRHLEVREVVVVPLTGQKNVHTIIHVCTDDQRNRLLGICFHRRHLFVDNVDQTVVVNDRRRIAISSGKLDRRVDEVQVVLLSASACGTKTPTSLFARFGR